MRPIIKYTMSAFAAAAMAASAQAAQTDYHLKLEGIDAASAARGAKDGQIEIMSWSWGKHAPLSEISGLKFEVDVIESHDRDKGDMIVKGSKIGQNAPAPTGGVRVAAGDVNGDGRADITSPRNAASGLPTGKRQHGPIKITSPLDRGSVTVNGFFRNCVAGAHYRKASLESAAARWEFTDAIITSCAAESISFNYASYRGSPIRQSPK